LRKFAACTSSEVLTASPISTVFCETWLPLATTTTRIRLPLSGTNSIR
jgi:hypothetical protein